MTDNPRGGHMTPEGNFAPADSLSHKMSCDGSVNSCAGERSSEAGVGPAGLPVIEMKCLPFVGVVVPSKTGVICRNGSVGIEGFLLPTTIKLDGRADECISVDKILRGATLENLNAYQVIAEKLVGWLVNHDYVCFIPMPVEPLVDYLKVLPIQKGWVPLRVIATEMSLFNPFADKTAILVY